MSDQAVVDLWYLTNLMVATTEDGQRRVSVAVKDHLDKWESGYLGQDPDELLYDLADGYEDSTVAAPGDSPPSWWPSDVDESPPLDSWRLFIQEDWGGRPGYEVWWASRYEDAAALAAWARANPAVAALYPEIEQFIAARGL